MQGLYGGVVEPAASASKSKPTADVQIFALAMSSVKPGSALENPPRSSDQFWESGSVQCPMHGFAAAALFAAQLVGTGS
jgi:hypothetical protein